MTVFKGFSGHYHPNPFGAEHRKSMADAGWRVLREDPLTWIAKDGSLMRVVPAPQEETTTTMAQWFVAGVMSSELLERGRVAAWDALTDGDWRYIVDLYEGDKEPAPDGLGPFETLAQAIAAAEDEVRRVADLAESERDPTMDWATRYRIRPYDQREDPPIEIEGFPSVSAFDEALAKWNAEQEGQSNPFLDEIDETREKELNSIDPALETEMRLVMGYRLVELLREALTAGMFECCRIGDMDPCDFIDDNEQTAQAYGETFGAGLVDAFGTPAEAEALSRANAATLVAANLIRGEDLSVARLRQLAEQNDPVGLSHTITRKGD